MAANKLTLNFTKSNLIAVEPNSRNSKQKLTFLVTQSYYSRGLTTFKSTKYLGITLDNQFSLNTPLDMLTKKLSRAFGILCKLKSFLNKTTLINVYYALFHSHIQYGLLAWSDTYKSYYNKTSILQNKALNVIGGEK